MILCLVFTPASLAEENWDEDGWLNTNLVQERLNNGDEFGCYGIPGLSWQADPGAVAAECRNYIEQRTVAITYARLKAFDEIYKIYTFLHL